MRTISVTLSMSLDGVIQAPGRPDEDIRGGFDRGGWAVPYNDDVMAQKMGEGMASSGTMLFGRRTYEDFFGYWPRQTDNPFTPYLNQATKYVVSSTLTDPLPWENSILLSGDPSGQCRQAQGRIRPRPRHCRQRRAGEIPAGGRADRSLRAADPSHRARSRSSPLR